MARHSGFSSERLTAMAFAGMFVVVQILGYVRCIGELTFFLTIAFGAALFVWPLFTKRFGALEAGIVIFLSILLLPLVYFLWISCAYTYF